MKQIWRGLLAAATAGACLFALCAGLIVADGLTDEVTPGDVAIVPGNQVYPDGTPSARLAARLDRAVELFEQRRARRVIVSGGTGKEGVPEGDAMKRYLVSKGVPASAVLVDNAGVDTWATARNATAIMRANDLRGAVVVSQHFHIARTRLAFRKQGIEAGGAHARFFELRDLYSTAREVPAYAQYALRKAD